MEDELALYDMRLWDMAPRRVWYCTKPSVGSWPEKKLKAEKKDLEWRLSVSVYAAWAEQEVARRVRMVVGSIVVVEVDGCMVCVRSMCGCVFNQLSDQQEKCRIVCSK